MSYTGWISTVSGHLFFHLSKPWNYRLDRIVGDMIYLDKKIDKERYIIISLLADMRDFRKNDTIYYTRIIFLAKTDSSINRKKVLNGKIYFLDNKNINHDTSEIDLIRDINLLTDKIKEYPQNQLENNIYEFEHHKDTQKSIIKQQEFIKNIKELQSSIEEYNSDNIYKRTMSFSLKSSGFVDIYDSSTSGSENSIESNKSDIRQAYYFLKFLFHNHVHHLKKSEDITRVYKTPQSSNQKYNFAKSMIKDIKKYIIEIRNEQSTINRINSFYDLKGIISYANTLLLLLEEDEYLNNKEHKNFINREKEYFKNVISSIDSSLFNKEEKSRTSIYMLLDIFARVLIIIIAISSPYIIFFIKEILDKKIDNINNFVFYNILPIYATVFFLILILISIYDLFSKREKSVIVRWSNRLKWYIELFLKKRNNNTLCKNIFFHRIINMIQIYHRKTFFTSVILKIVTLPIIIGSIYYII